MCWFQGSRRVFLVSLAELRHKHRIPLADSVIAATSLFLDATCISDDTDLKAIEEIRTRWI